MNSGWSIILVSPNTKTAGDLMNFITQHVSANVTDLGNYPTSRSITELRQGGGANLCFLDMEADCPRAIACIPD